MALPAQRSTPAPSPARPGAGRAALLPREPGRATDVLYRRHGNTVFRYAWHLLGRREDAEDATQATFLAAHGALASGTAVLEPGAWVLRIARNECMGRLRDKTRRPAAGSLGDDVDPPAPGSVERSAELRDEVRTARQTLRGLPVPEREAFVLREWLGLETSEVARTLGLTNGDVDVLATRARRTLVLAVGGLEPAVGCAATQAALEAGSLDRAARVHLLRCPICRGVRRALRPPDDAAGGPAAAVRTRLAAVLPGFASGGGGIAAALAGKAAAAPLVAKTAALVAAAIVTGGAVEQAIVSTHPSHRIAAPAKARGAQAHALASASSATARRASIAVTAPLMTLRHTATAKAPTRGGAAGPSGEHGANGSGDDHGSSRGRDDGGSAALSSGGEQKTRGDDGSSTATGGHSSDDNAPSPVPAPGSGDSGATRDDHGGSSGSGTSDDGSGDTTSGGAQSHEGDDGGSSAASDPATTPAADTSGD